MIEVPHLRGVESDGALFRAVQLHADLIAVYPFYGPHVAIRDGKFAVVGSELDAVALSKIAVILAVSRNALQSLWIIGGLLAVRLLDRDLVLFVVGGYHGCIAALFNAVLLAAARVMENVVGLVPRCPASIDAGQVDRGIGAIDCNGADRQWNNAPLL